MTCYESVEKNLADGMVQGQMHKCLRDIGRRAGGYLATGSLTSDECDRLGQVAVSLSINKAEARRKWADAIEFGRRSPLHWEESSAHVGAVDAVPLSWDSQIAEDDLKVVNPEWLEDEVVEEPSRWDPCKELTEYLNILFTPEDIIGYCVNPFQKDDRWIPSRGVYDRTVAEILKELKKGRLDNALGTPNEESGGYIRINPLDGKGVKDVNVTDFRYALVESDGMDIEKQVAIYHKLELPCACIVHSGGKSAHAIVKVFASDLDEYHKRVDFLFEVCAKNGLPVDRQNRNPSRYSRMPGLMRKGKKQFVIDRTCGKASWEEWEDWIRDLNDDLPDFETLCDFKERPALAPEQIEGILRVGHKMCIAGPSKAGKSYLLIELAIAVAEGSQWLGHKCRPGRVLYCNFEVDRNSCINRFFDVYKAMGASKAHADMISFWHLRGRTMPLDKLSPRLIRRCAAAGGYSLIILDPAYKVLTGDENSAAEMSEFCRHLDRIARDCNATLVFCHHHSKGSQGGKRSMDRASGSGVFARDPDALIDILPLESESARKVFSNNAECDAIRETAKQYAYSDDWLDSIGEDDQLVADRFIAAVGRMGFDEEAMSRVRDAREKIRMELERISGWRASFTLREFPAMKEQNMWFRFPVHLIDDDGLLEDCAPEGEETAVRRSYQRKEKKDKMTTFETFRQQVMFDPNVTWTIDKAANLTKKSERTILRWCKKIGWEVNHGVILTSKGEES